MLCAAKTYVSWLATTFSKILEMKGNFEIGSSGEGEGQRWAFLEEGE